MTQLGHDVEVLEFADLDLSRDDLHGIHAIYTSSEDAGAHYKRYIEAKIIGLRMVGARPIPEPELLLAHHDKVMMESVRQTRLSNSPGQLACHAYGTLEEFQSHSGDWAERPAVMKPAQGAGFRGVTLVHDRKEGLRTARRLSRSFGVREMDFELAKRWRHHDYIHRSWHRRSIILQQFLPNLAGDYKVVPYGERFYNLGRANRPNHFRARRVGRLRICPGDYITGTDGWTRVEETCDLSSVFAMVTSAHIGSRNSRGEVAVTKCILS